MAKDFDAWNTQKRELDALSKVPEFSQRELWWCSFGHNVGYETDGKGKKFRRPVLIVRKFNKFMFWGAALTSVPPKPHAARFYKQVSYNGQPHNVQSYVILSQIRTFSSKRLLYREGRLTSDDFRDVVEAIKGLYP
ncbi:MAG: type II toxin-antitoxin system PemK/MazF family toxin [Deinococcota bacterium]